MSPAFHVFLATFCIFTTPKFGLGKLFRIRKRFSLDRPPILFSNSSNSTSFWARDFWETSSDFKFYVDCHTGCSYMQLHRNWKGGLYFLYTWFVSRWNYIITRKFIVKGRIISRRDKRYTNSWLVRHDSVVSSSVICTKYQKKLFPPPQRPPSPSLNLTSDHVMAIGTKSFSTFL